MTAEELYFFDKMPDMLPLYEVLMEKLTAAYPDMTLNITKTQISFRNRYVFAMVSLPWKRIKGYPERYLLISFGLPDRKDDPRIRQSVEAYPGRWTHHVVTERVEDIDDILMEWIHEAYLFALNKKGNQVIAKQ